MGGKVDSLRYISEVSTLSISYRINDLNIGVSTISPKCHNLLGPGVLTIDLVTNILLSWP